jgi:hypothetical protein
MFESAKNPATGFLFYAAHHTTLDAFRTVLAQ